MAHFNAPFTCCSPGPWPSRSQQGSPIPVGLPSTPLPPVAPTITCEHAGFVTALLGVAFPFPTLQGCRAQQLKTWPECGIRGLHDASSQGIRATSANLFRKPRSALGCSEARRPSRSAPQILIFRNAIVTFRPWNWWAGDHDWKTAAHPLPISLSFPTTTIHDSA